MKSQIITFIILILSFKNSKKRVYTTKSMQKSIFEIHKQKEEKKESWNCEVCSFENNSLLIMCEICDAKRGDRDFLDHFKEERESRKAQEIGFTCHNCGTTSIKLEKKCGNCGEVLIPDGSDDQLPEKINKVVACPSCGFENHPDNTLCVSCENLMKPKLPKASIRKFPQARRRSSRAKNVMACRHCEGVFKKAFLKTHQLTCSKGVTENIKDVIRHYCSFCYQKISNSEVQQHEKQCKSREQFFAPDHPAYDRLTPLQRNTIIYMHTKCENDHWINEKHLISRIQKLGYKSQDLQNLHHYIVNYAPIIIHMHVNRHMEFFLKDTHYRNQFETKKSAGSLSFSARINWQDRMFDNKHHSATPFERVKYGTINFTNDPKGVRACSGYGQSYFLLKEHVRSRCTVTDMDSSSPRARIGTFQFCFQVLNKLSDAELKAAFDASKGKEVVSNIIRTYKEIQIHGPVQFSKDVEKVYVSRAELIKPKFEDMVKQFCHNNELEYQIFQFQTVPATGGIFGGISSLFGTGSVMPPPIKTLPKTKIPKKPVIKKTAKKRAPRKKRETEISPEE